MTQTRMVQNAWMDSVIRCVACEEKDYLQWLKKQQQNKTMYTGEAQAYFPENTELIHIKRCSDRDI